MSETESPSIDGWTPWLDEAGRQTFVGDVDDLIDIWRADWGAHTRRVTASTLSPFINVFGLYWRGATPDVAKFPLTPRTDVVAMLRTIADELESGSLGDPLKLQMAAVVLGEDSKHEVWCAGRLSDLSETAYWLLGCGQHLVMINKGPR